MAEAKGVVTRMEESKNGKALFVNIECVTEVDKDGFYETETHRITVFDDYRDAVERTLVLETHATLKFDNDTKICTGGRFKAVKDVTARKRPKA